MDAVLDAELRGGLPWRSIGPLSRFSKRALMFRLNYHLQSPFNLIPDRLWSGPFDMGVSTIWPLVDCHESCENLTTFLLYRESMQGEFPKRLFSAAMSLEKVDA